MKNTKIVDFKKIGNDKGYLTPIEGEIDVDFCLKRVYYIYGVQKNERRGFHAHENLSQILLCVNGSVKVLCKTPYEEEIFLLDEPNKGLFIGNMIWREMFDFSDDAVLLVLASEHYNEDDYFRNYNDYLNRAILYFRGEK